MNTIDAFFLGKASQYIIKFTFLSLKYSTTLYKLVIHYPWLGSALNPKSFYSHTVAASQVHRSR